ncbi:hypothetical protein PPERSA_04028 [Pseudocohnilembus persalinus]|uniref:Transmembrane protein n=1 Tax=Pseudocohnilembus persalinus TaxID=266149 RepID=A0A0V0QKJ0_PSEPJ|nr:hypothetical protein PPERSA_04028 [Pseudocohnilembus persalinus]|eukprot:KRX02825.1 hypothetical protein PPERSA_04028 [Pseudocohnilembus persalinus]
MENLQNKQKKREIFRFLLLTISFGLLNGVVFALLPFIFYRPVFQCFKLKENFQEINSNYLIDYYDQFQCTELEACQIYPYEQMIILENFSMDKNQNFQVKQIENNVTEKLQQFQIYALYEYGQIYSISKEFQLFCDKKIFEANIISMTVIAATIGATFAIFYSIPRSIEQEEYQYQNQQGIVFQDI